MVSQDSPGNYEVPRNSLSSGESRESLFLSVIPEGELPHESRTAAAEPQNSRPHSFTTPSEYSFQTESNSERHSLELESTSTESLDYLRVPQPSHARHSISSEDSGDSYALSIIPESVQSQEGTSIHEAASQSSRTESLNTRSDSSTHNDSGSSRQDSENTSSHTLNSSRPSSVDQNSQKQAHRNVSFYTPTFPERESGRPSSTKTTLSTSEIDPTSQGDLTPATPPTRPSLAYLRSKSLGAAPFHGGFRNLWVAHDSHSNSSSRSASRSSSRSSSPDGHSHRPSMVTRAFSAVVPENPIPEAYRSKSVSSLGFFTSSLESSTTTLPFFHDDIESQKETIQEYLAGVEVLQASKVRNRWQAKGFRIAYFLMIAVLLYFLIIGQPLWEGLALVVYRFIRSPGVGAWGCALFMGWGAFQAFVPMLSTRFEQEVDNVESRDASEVALVIPAYKAAAVLPETIKAALKIFKPEQIFIIANGNTEEPTDNTADVCGEFGVNHAWVPIGSKLVAEFIGVTLSSKYKYTMLIDDDVHLPSNLPMVTNRLVGAVKCIGYTIKSTGADGAKGTYIQQCQDMEYKISGLTRYFCGRFGSATFPHGAIILWETKILRDLFNIHPGYVISEDWYFGHAARSCGYRIVFCSQVFVETETPPALFKATSAARGGFGEMTVYKQRFGRWNYFFLMRIWEDTVYILLSWRLGWREIVTKIWVTVEVYDSVMALLRPFIIVITALAAWRLLLYLTLAATAMYISAFSLFNTWHLRRKNEMIAWKVLPVYMGMKFILLWVNSLSVYYGMWDYARYFSVRHPKVIENHKVLEIAYKIKLGAQLVPLNITSPEEAQEAGIAPEIITEAPLRSRTLLKEGYI